MDASKLPRPLRRFASKIAEVSDERGYGEGYWVYFHRGWILWPDGTHQIHENSPTACSHQFYRVEACDCAYCRGDGD